VAESVLECFTEAALLDCVDFIRSLSNPRLVTMVVQCTPPDAIVSADPARLNQILYNLLSNALKFTPTGGQISVSAVVDAAGAIIAVRDSGVGNSPADEALVFEPFGQVKTAGSAPIRGDRVGIATRARPGRAAWQRIWLAGADGAGSCFTFT
jgi:signal transduction histidine kinase